MRRLALSVFALAVLAQQGDVVFKSTTNLVIIDVFARDRAGKDIGGLKKEDFVILEDGKPQVVSIFEFQKLDAAPSPTLPQPSAPRATTPQAQQIIASAGAGKVQYRDKRLMIFFFDFSAMPPADQIRSQTAAIKFIDEQMSPADMVSVMTFGTSLKIEQDFTGDREQLKSLIKGFGNEANELSGEAATADENEEDTGAAFQADESEFNIFNTDRKLSALESATKMLAALPEKKALVYFSSGVGKTGVENQSQLRSTVNAAVRANVSFYPIDARGLTALPPGGDASTGSPRGQGIFTGSAQRQRESRFQDQQETLVTLANDTGGKPFLDSNDLTLGIQQAQNDIRSYYILGYYSTNGAEDGRFRRLQVRLANNPQAKLDFRSGYFAPKQFAKFNEADKEQQLSEALMLGDPVTDLPLAIEVNYFRISRERYFVPMAVKIPGADVAMSRKGANESTELDFIGQVRDAKGRLAGAVRDGIRVKLTEADAAQLQRRNFQYDTGFALAPGEYTLKFLARENQNGKIGTFETKFTVPDVTTVTDRLRTSSVVFSNQREAMKSAVGSASGNRRLLGANPLVDNDQKLIPSITRVFRRNQSLYVYMEVYDAGAGPDDKKPSLLTKLSFYRGRRKAFESAPIHITEATNRRPGVIPVQFQVPLEKLVAGTYTCQVSVIDEIGKKFAFPRASLVLLP